MWARKVWRRITEKGAAPRDDSERKPFAQCQDDQEQLSRRLFQAIFSGDVEGVREALLDGADPNALLSDSNKPALWVAIDGECDCKPGVTTCRHFEMAKLLIEAGARLEWDSPTASPLVIEAIIFNKIRSNEGTLEHQLSREECLLDFLRFLWQAGANFLHPQILDSLIFWMHFRAPGPCPRSFVPLRAVRFVVACGLDPTVPDQPWNLPLQRHHIAPLPRRPSASSAATSSSTETTAAAAVPAPMETEEGDDSEEEEERAVQWFDATALKGPYCLDGPFDPANLRVGQLVDALDTSVWRRARVVDVREGKEGKEYMVHYLGWRPRWNEWLPANSAKIAPFLSKWHPDPGHIWGVSPMARAQELARRTGNTDAVRAMEEGLRDLHRRRLLFAAELCTAFPVEMHKDACYIISAYYS